MKNYWKLDKSRGNTRKYLEIIEKIGVQEGPAYRKILIKYAQIRADEAPKRGVLPQNQASPTKTLAGKEPHNRKLLARTIKTLTLQFKAWYWT